MKIENYLINELENERKLNIMFISHNAYWYNLQQLEKKYENCQVDISGCCAFKSWNKDKGENSDLIFYYSDGYFDENDLEYLEQKISRISQNENKRVSLGYSYLIPYGERIDENISEKMIIVSYCDNIRDEIIVDIDSLLPPLSIAGVILKTSDDLNKQKIKRI